MAFVIIILQSFDHYHDGDWSLNGGYLYVTAIYNVSVSLALYGVLLAVLEKIKVINPIIDGTGQPTSAGTVSAGYQNFLICIEMLFASIALRAAFPYHIYASSCVTDSSGRSVTMQSISSSLKVSTRSSNI
ncbi:oligopeptidase A [Sarracenia purpurea var. burkii]